MPPPWQRVSPSAGRVDSRPPCALLEAVKAEYTLSAGLPPNHRGPVVSMNCRSWAAGLPKRAGVPNSTASAHSRSPCPASATSAVSRRCRAQAGWASITSGGAVPAALRSRTCAPAFSAPSTAARARACAWPLVL